MRIDSKLDLNVCGDVRGKLSLDRLTLEAAHSGYLLGLHGTALMPWRAGMKALAIAGFMGDVAVGRSGSELKPLTSLQSSQAVLVSAEGELPDSSVTLTGIITREALEAVELARGDAGLHWRIMLRGHVSWSHAPITCTLSGQFSVTRSQWSEALEDAGYCEVLYLALRAPQDGRPVGVAAEHVSSARKHYLRGEYRASAASCRSALETLQEHVRSMTDGKQGPEEGLLSRIAKVALAYQNACHLAAHANNEAAISARWDARSARFLLHGTAAVVAYLEEGHAPASLVEA